MRDGVMEMIDDMSPEDAELLRLQPAMVDALNAVLFALHAQLADLVDFNWQANDGGTSVTVEAQTHDGRHAEATAPVGTARRLH